MKKTFFMTIFALTFLCGILVGNVAAKKGDGVTPAVWEGVSSKDAAARFLVVSAELAEPAPMAVPVFGWKLSQLNSC